MTRSPPADCRTMSELRVAIDRVDEELIQLFADRMAYIHRAAELKRDAGIPANVPERVEEVVANTRARADARGLDPDLYGRFWSDIVAAAIAEEERRLGNA